MSQIDNQSGYDSKTFIQEPQLSELAHKLLETQIETRTIKKLKARTPVRDLELREGVKLNISRATNIEAALVQIMGNISGKPCTHCKKEYGPFTQCVSMKGLLLGACASCHYGCEGKRCSFRTDMEDEQKPERLPRKKHKRARTDDNATSERLPTVAITTRVPRAELYKVARKLHKAAKRLRKAAVLLEHYTSLAEKEY